MAIFDAVEARAFANTKTRASICRTQAAVYRIEHFRASTIDAPEVYERCTHILLRVWRFPQILRKTLRKGLCKTRKSAPNARF
jgi:hypothetical protein